MRYDCDGGAWAWPAGRHNDREHFQACGAKIPKTCLSGSVAHFDLIGSNKKILESEILECGVLRGLLTLFACHRQPFSNGAGGSSSPRYVVVMSIDPIGAVTTILRTAMARISSPEAMPMERGIAPMAACTVAFGM